jgi:hypothetical protein
LSRRIQPLLRLPSAATRQPGFTDATYSAVCCTSTDELHEHISVPHECGEQVLDLVAGQLDQAGRRRIAGLERDLWAVTRMGLRLLEHSLEDQNMAGAVVIGEIDVEPHPNELPTFVRERVEVLKEHSRVESRIEPSQVPDVNSVLDCLHRSLRWPLFAQIRREASSRSTIDDFVTVLCRRTPTVDRGLHGRLACRR